MKWLIIGLVILFALLQYKLWMADDGIREVRAFHQQVAEQRQKNIQLSKENDQLRAEVKDLKQGMDAPEERARMELGMVKPNEQYYQIVQERKKA